MNTFRHTRKALMEYERTTPERAAAWAWAESTQDCDAAKAADKAALEAVQQAYYEDTKDINSREQCRHLDIDFARKMANLPWPR